MNTYRERASEAEALVQAVVKTLESVPASRREALLADLIKDADVERAIRRVVEKSRKAETPTFSVCKAAMQNRSTYGAVRQGGTPSQIAKRISKGTK
jgi:2-hydroxy-3-keto-5-methylthiopentenyl-1-phosphate phosphatase